MRPLTFPRGIHPRDHKEATNAKLIEDGPLPDVIILPLQQSAGACCLPAVDSGDKVLVGQKIGDSEALIAAPIHSPVSGTVKAIEPRPHHTGLKLSSVVIESDGQQKHVECKGLSANPSPDEIRRKVRDAGIVGLGGAAFPTQVKLDPPKGQEIVSLIINGCECEPYLTGDHRIMVEEPEQILDGMLLLMKAVEAENGYIGIETNKPDAIEAMIAVTEKYPDIEVIALEEKYPQGSEKQLIEAILDVQVAPNMLPCSVGALVQNVATSIAVSKACRDGLPLVERVITVSGNGIATPKNLRVAVGTRVSDVIDFCGGTRDQVVKLILGGPMMGTTLVGREAPVVKGTSAILALTNDEIAKVDVHPCIKCGKCVEVCPMLLLPYRFGAMVEFGVFDELEDNHIFNCIECGSCAFICPSQLPLVQYIKLGKYSLAQSREKSRSA